MKKLLYILLFVPSALFAQESNLYKLPDNEFLFWLEENIPSVIVNDSLDINLAATLEEFSDDFSYMDITSTNIQNLDGLQYFIKLTQIQIQSNPFLYNIPNLSGFTNLSYFSCNFNMSLTNLDLSDIPNLTFIDVMNCQALESLNISELQNLQFLNLAYCGALNIDGFSSTTSLVGLDLFNLTLDTLNLSSHSNLEHLSLSNINNLTSLDLSSLHNLSVLDVRNINNITSLDLSTLISLSRLCVENINNITSLDISPLINLSNLRVWNNNDLTNIVGLFSLTQLEVLSIYNPNLNLERDFSMFTNLNGFNSFNLNCIIYPTQLASSNIPPCGEGNCNDINASNYNPIATLNDGSCEYFSTAHIESNLIDILSSNYENPMIIVNDSLNLDVAQSVTGILTNNNFPLSSSVSYLSNIVEVQIEYEDNLLSLEILNDFPNLGRLHFENCAFLVTPSISNINIEHLSFSNNVNLTSISDLSGLTSLTDLMIVDNPNLNDIPDLSELQGLQNLDIYNSGVTTIPDLSELVNLESLVLEANNNLVCVYGYPAQFINEVENYPICIEGCTYSLAINFDSLANLDDGSCQIEGCMDSNANNYDSSANVGDGLCEYDINLYNIPDTNFLYCLQENHPALIINDSLDIYEANLTTELFLDCNSFNNFDGIQHFVNLNSLYIEFDNDNNETGLDNFSNIDISSLNNLVQLDIWEANISELSFPNPSNLISIEIVGCILPDSIGISNLPYLSMCNFSINNGLNHLTLSELPSLTSTHIGGNNELNSVGISQLSNIEDISITIEYNPSLTCVDAHSEELSNLFIDNLLYNSYPLCNWGCIDDLAINYDSTANIESGTCEYYNTYPIYDIGVLQYLKESYPDLIVNDSLNLDEAALYDEINFNSIYIGSLDILNAFDNLYILGVANTSIQTLDDIPNSVVLAQIGNNDSLVSITSSSVPDFFMLNDNNNLLSTSVFGSTATFSMVNSGVEIIDFYNPDNVSETYDIIDIRDCNELKEISSFPYHVNLINIQNCSSLTFLPDIPLTTSNLEFSGNDNIACVGDYPLLFEDILGEYPKCEEGCTDSLSANYNELAYIDDNSCISYQQFLIDSLQMANQVLLQVTQNDSSCISQEQFTNDSLYNIIEIAYSDISNLEDSLSLAMLNQEDGINQVDIDLLQVQLDSANLTISELNTLLSNSVVNVNYLEEQLTIALENQIVTIYIDIYTGWNMIGFSCSFEKNVEDALDNLVDKVIILKDNSGVVYMPEFNFNGIGNFTPGHGYQLKVTDNILDFNICE